MVQQLFDDTRTSGKTFKSTLTGTLLNNIHIDSNGNATGSQPTGIETVSAAVSIDGQSVTTVRVADMLQQFSGISGNSRLVCNGDTLQQFINLPNIEGPYVFKR